MKTDDLVNLLAKDAALPRRGAMPSRLPLAAAALVSAAVMAATLGLRSDLAQMPGVPLFWFKCLFVAALALLAWRTATIAAIPGARFGAVPWLFAAPLLVMAAAVGVTLLGADAPSRAAQFWGSTWRTCPLLIALLSLPMFAAMLHLMRGLAPTRLRLAGALAGFTAGSGAALLYCLHCPELAPAFVSVWYLLGILIPTVIGALIGRAALRW